MKTMIEGNLYEDTRFPIARLYEIIEVQSDPVLTRFFQELEHRFGFKISLSSFYGLGFQYFNDCAILVLYSLEGYERMISSKYLLPKEADCISVEFTKSIMEKMHLKCVEELDCKYLYFDDYIDEPKEEQQNEGEIISYKTLVKHRGFLDRVVEDEVLDKDVTLLDEKAIRQLTSTLQKKYDIVSWDVVYENMAYRNVFYSDYKCECGAGLIGVIGNNYMGYGSAEGGHFVLATLYICPRCKKQISFEVLDEVYWDGGCKFYR